MVDKHAQVVFPVGMNLEFELAEKYLRHIQKILFGTISELPRLGNYNVPLSFNQVQILDAVISYVVNNAKPK